MGKSRKDYHCVPPTEKRRAKIRMTLSYHKTLHLQIRRKRKNYKRIVLSEFPPH